MPIHKSIQAHNLVLKGKGGIYMSYGYPNPCCYPAPYPVYPVPYATGGGGWYALFIVVLYNLLLNPQSLCIRCASNFLYKHT
jgi:hypothetical protein